MTNIPYKKKTSLYLTKTATKQIIRNGHQNRNIYFFTSHYYLLFIAYKIICLYKYILFIAKTIYQLFVSVDPLIPYTDVDVHRTHITKDVGLIDNCFWSHVNVSSVNDMKV